MPQSKRYTTTKEERTQMVIDKGNPKNSCKNKLSEYLSQPNVKKFNCIITDKNFDTIKKRGYPRFFNSVDECLEEVEDYFKLCYDCDMIPTIASLSLYLGVNRETLYNYANNPRIYEYSNIVKSAIDTCQSYQESAVLSGDIPSVPFIFLSKNYFNLKDTTDVRVNNDTQDNTINSNTMSVIREQIEMENQKNLELLEDKKN